MSVAVPGHDPILLDIGTGARYFGMGWPDDRVFRGTCLLSHLHWDHVQGLPFFAPLLRDGAHLDVYAPKQDGEFTAAEIMEASLRPPLFPIGLADFPGTVTFVEAADEDFTIGDVKVMSRLIPHRGNTCGYRLEWNGASVAYLSDHQQPGVGVFDATDNARELCNGVDVLVHDAQYTPDEFRERSDWGHCTVEYAVWLAVECGVGTLVMYHHDPGHDDDQIDRFVAEANAQAAGTDVKVIGAREGLTLPVPV